VCDLFSSIRVEFSDVRVVLSHVRVELSDVCVVLSHVRVGHSGVRARLFRVRVPFPRRVHLKLWLVAQR
jgi:hypothetical protein